VLLGALALAADGEDAVVQLDCDLVLRDAREIEGKDELVLGLPHVDGRQPRRGLPVAGRGAARERAHPPAHLVLKGGELTERFEAYECHSRPSSRILTSEEG
jgi:hypothetical protein